MRERLPRVAIGLLALSLLLAAIAHAEVSQKRGLRVTVSGDLSPRALPRSGVAPVAVAVAGRISTTDGSEPPQLKTLRIEFNRNGRLDQAGLPICRVDQIQPASSARALSACRGSLVGQGRFSANIVLSGQHPYPTKGRLLVFNGTDRGRPALLGQIYAPRPFATSFVIVFTIQKLRRGPYGTALTASLPEALGDWGYVTGISLRLSRRFTHAGGSRSFLSAGCPAPKGFGGASFPLARTGFAFSDGRKLDVTLNRSCGVRG